MGKQNAAVQDKPLDWEAAPTDWSDRKAWDKYHQANSSKGPFAIPTALGAPGWQSVRFLDLVNKKGGRVWLPGCGTDIAPSFYASIGCRVVATDFSPVAVRVQRTLAAMPPERLFKDWSSFGQQSDRGKLDVAEQDFTIAAPEGIFDVVLNCRAFQGLSPKAMRGAAKRFFAALRPGGVVVIDTINVQGSAARNEIEDSLDEAGFYLPFNQVERWYREQLDGVDIPYVMILGRPRVQYNRNSSAKSSMAQWERNQSILDSFTAEYQARRAREEALELEICNQPETKVAHVVYPTG